MKKAPEFGYYEHHEPVKNNWHVDDPLKKQVPENIPSGPLPKKPLAPKTKGFMKELLEADDTPKKVEKKHETPEEAKERRTELIDRSFALKKHFEDKPIPHDPHLVARLMVAEHILAINEQLEEPEKAPKHISPKELTLALDYMGEIAEKLEDPSIESPPEIQDAYETLLQLTEEALEETPANDIVQLVVNNMTNETMPRPEPSPVYATDRPAVILPERVLEPEDHTSPPAVARVIRTLSSLRAAHNRPLPPAPDDLSPGPLKAPSDGGTRSIPATGRPQYADTLTVPQRRYESSPVPRQPINHERPYALPSAAAPIAAVAISAALLHNRPDYPKPSETFRPLPPEPSEAPRFRSKSEETSTSPFSSSRQESSSTPSHPPQAVAPLYEQPYHELIHNTHQNEPTPTHTLPPEHETSHSLPPKSSRKIEHYPLYTLLHMAEAVPLGHGRYLREMFEKNEIDKEGLVKILKSRAKGKDFTQEFHRQYARFQHIKSSPEFLHNLQPSTHTQDDDDTSPDPFFIQQPEPPVLTPKPPVTPMSNLPAHPISQATKPSPLPKQQTNPTESSIPPFVWIVAILAALLVLVLMLMFMF